MNGALCKHVSVWIVNYVVSLPFNIKLLEGAYVLSNFSSFSLSCAPLQTGFDPICIETVFKFTKHIHVVKSNCQLSLIFLMFEQLLT